MPARSTAAFFEHGHTTREHTSNDRIRATSRSAPALVARSTPSRSRTASASHQPAFNAVAPSGGQSVSKLMVPRLACRSAVNCLAR